MNGQFAAEVLASGAAGDRDAFDGHMPILLEDLCQRPGDLPVVRRRHAVNRRACLREMELVPNEEDRLRRHLCRPRRSSIAYSPRNLRHDLRVDHIPDP
jgi:hypothetical protein